jgi:hypothetical protein
MKKKKNKNKNKNSKFHMKLIQCWSQESKAVIKVLDAQQNKYSTAIPLTRKNKSKK